jgi:hypothetical protein
MRLVVISIAAAGLLGCFAPAVYVKPGATQTEWADDHQFCELYAQRMNENTTWSRGITHAAIVRGCLEERGWQRQR